MDYIILNGKSSRLIGGLMIQTLPPITKPLMRTQVETIDGRDGDLVTKLGYSAYDKEITVGLYGDYDVDEIIKYFDSEGTVIFSNELDKYYQYQIIDQIDFEKLIRFKTATVTFHVQPFKYSSVEKPLIMDNMLSIPDQTITENGVTISISDGDISISGNATTKPMEIYIPINPLIIEKGKYRLLSAVSGDGEKACILKIIKGSPLDSDSFGGSYIDFTSSKHVDADVSGKKTYDCLWMYFYNGIDMDFTFNLSVLSCQFNVNNLGNAISRPILTLYGSGEIVVDLNGQSILDIIMPTDLITIDAESMEAYKGNTLLNRYVSGNYRSLALKSGFNALSWTGNVTKAVLSKYSRWI